MKIKETRFGKPDPVFIAGIDGKGPSPFSIVEFLNGKKEDETTLQKIASEEYDSIVQSVSEAGLIQPPRIMATLNEIMAIESGHKQALETLAIETVVKNFGLPDEIREMLEAKIITDEELDCDPSDDEEEEEEELTEDELEVANELIQRRIVQNALMMGSGYRAHKLFSGLRESLDILDPNLMPLYESFLPSVEYYLWKMEIPVPMRINWGKCEITNDEKDGIKGKAKAKCFIILLHEVAKIAVEILFLQSLQDIHDKYGEKVKKYVINQADRYEDEQWMKLIGPRMWKHLHDCLDYLVKAKDGNYTVVSYLLNTIGILYPENFFAMMEVVLNDGESATLLLGNMYDQIKEEIDRYNKEQEELESGPKTRSGKSKRLRQVHEFSVEELNAMITEAVENEEYEKAAYLKSELDKR